MFLIYNSFNISLNERTHQFGILMSVGATEKQLRNSVLFEGLCIGIIGIPIGILVGMHVPYKGVESGEKTKQVKAASILSIVAIIVIFTWYSLYAGVFRHSAGNYTPLCWFWVIILIPELLCLSKSKINTEGHDIHAALIFYPMNFLS